MDENKKRPSGHSKNKEEARFGKWINTQQQNYKKKKEAMKDEDKYNLWTQFIQEYLSNSAISTSTETAEQEKKTIIIKKRSKKSTKLSIQIPVVPIPNPNPNIPNPDPTQPKAPYPFKSQLSTLHQRYKTLTSRNLHEEFQSNPEKWHEYHAIAEQNETTFHPQDIPRNRLISWLDKEEPFDYQVKVADLGCGKAQISRYFSAAGDQRYQFINYDHIASATDIHSCDIAHIPLPANSVRICILSLAMWGANCADYLAEAYRVLGNGGILYISEPTKRWTEEGGDAPADKLQSLLEGHGFIITDKQIDKFCLFRAMKNKRKI